VKYMISELGMWVRRTARIYSGSSSRRPRNYYVERQWLPHGSGIFGEETKTVRRDLVLTVCLPVLTFQRGLRVWCFTRDRRLSILSIIDDCPGCPLSRTDPGFHFPLRRGRLQGKPCEQCYQPFLRSGCKDPKIRIRIDPSQLPAEMIDYWWR